MWTIKRAFEVIDLLPQIGIIRRLALGRLRSGFLGSWRYRFTGHDMTFRLAGFCI